MVRIIQHSSTRLEPLIYFKDEPLSERLTLPGSMMLWPSLMEQITTYKLHNRGTKPEALRLAARYGGPIISDPYARFIYEEILSGRINYQDILNQRDPDPFALFPDEFQKVMLARRDKGVVESAGELKAMLAYAALDLLLRGVPVTFEPKGWPEVKRRLFGSDQREAVSR